VEIKDYSPNNLLTIATSGYWELLDDNKKISVSNPFDQIYQYWRAIKDRINFSHFPEEIKIHVIRLVVFSQISENDDLAEILKQKVPEKVQLCFKEILGRIEQFKSYLNDILPINYNLERKYFQLLRANLIPSCRLPTRDQSDLLKYFTPEDRIKLLDLEQERFARKLGEGHRLIFGVAGSGKTVILIARARFLAMKQPDWKILILCYNRLLRDAIFNMFNPQDYDADITISTFHSWIHKYTQSVNNKFSQIYREAREKAEREDKWDDFFNEFVPSLFKQMLNDLGDKKVLYDAILIDEAQDMMADWFNCIIPVLNPKTNSLLITCDGLQGIYARKRFTWKSVGIQAIGRVKKFAKTYRTPVEIGILAQKALPTSLRDLLDKHDEFISTKEYIGDHGIVEIVLSNSRAEEYELLAEKINRLLKNPQEILVLSRYNIAKYKDDHPFFKALLKMDIEWEELQNHNFETPRLTIGTIHGSKGLECDTIIIPEVNTYFTNNRRQLLYVAITRSRKKLILSAHRSSLLLKSFESSQNSSQL